MDNEYMEVETLKNELETLSKNPEWPRFEQVLSTMLEIHDNTMTNLRNFIECCSNLASGDQVIQIVQDDESCTIINTLTDYIRNDKLC